MKDVEILKELAAYADHQKGQLNILSESLRDVEADVMNVASSDEETNEIESGLYAIWQVYNKVFEKNHSVREWLKDKLEELEGKEE